MTRTAGDRIDTRLAAGIVMLAVVAAAAIGGPWLATDPWATSGPLLAPPTGGHPFGTDELGRDVFSRVIRGAGTSLEVAIGAVIPATIAGSLLGLVAGYAGGLADEVVLLVIELFQVLPRFVLALVATALVGPRLPVIVAVLAVTGWPFTARVARSLARGLRDIPYVEAARSLGSSAPGILWRHVLPGALPVLAVYASFEAGMVVLIESGLAFLGLSDRNLVSWGAMLADAQAYVGVAWWLSVFPGAALGIAVLGLNLLGDGLDSALDAGVPAPWRAVLGHARRLRRAGARLGTAGTAGPQRPW